MSQAAVVVGSKTTVQLVRATVWLILIAAVIAGIATLILGIVSLASTLSAGDIRLTLIAGGSLPAAGGNPAHIVNGGFDTASLTLRGMSVPVVAFSIISSVALLLTQLALCVLAAVLASRLLRGRPFRRSISVIVSLAGGVLLIGGLLSQLGNLFGGALAAVELNATGHSFWPLAGRFDPTLMSFGFVLLLIGIAFEYGEHLQKETEGLV